METAIVMAIAGMSLLVLILFGLPAFFGRRERKRADDAERRREDAYQRIRTGVFPEDISAHKKRRSHAHRRR
jgi:hypothetical protein